MRTRRRLDAGPQAYLALEDRRDPALAMHEIVATTPELGYRLEMEWRELPREFRHVEAESSPAAAPAVDRSLSNAARGRHSLRVPGAARRHAALDRDLALA